LGVYFQAYHGLVLGNGGVVHKSLELRGRKLAPI
jgi:hypothetical protein